MISWNLWFDRIKNKREKNCDHCFGPWSGLNTDSDGSMDPGQIGITDRDSGCGSGFLPFSGRPKLSPKTKKGKSKEILFWKVPFWAGSFSWSQIVLWRILRRHTLYYIYDGLNKIAIKRPVLDPCQDPDWIRIQQQHWSGSRNTDKLIFFPVNANIVPFYWQEWMCEPAGECVHIVSDDVQLLTGESRLVCVAKTNPEAEFMNWQFRRGFWE